MVGVLGLLGVLVAQGAVAWRIMWERAQTRREDALRNLHWATELALTEGNDRRRAAGLEILRRMQSWSTIKDDYQDFISAVLGEGVDPLVDRLQAARKDTNPESVLQLPKQPEGGGEGS